ncbi:MAG: RNA polymerase sigma factor [Aureispira sp.]
MSKSRSFETIYATYWPKVFRLCLGYLNDRSSAQDACQEIFIKVWQGLPKFRQEAALGTWIFRIASNHCLRQLKQDQKRVALSTTDLPETSLPETPSLEGPMEYLYQCIAQLPELERIIISLELEELPQAEIAAIVGISPSHVRVKIHRIKKKIQQKFQTYDAS